MSGKSQLSSPIGVINTINNLENDSSIVENKSETKEDSPRERMKRRVSFWTKKLVHFQSKTSAIVSFWNEEYTQVRLGYGTILQAIHGVDSSIRIKGITSLENSLFYFIDFENESDKMSCLNGLKKVNEYNVKFMTKQDIMENIEMKIFWLPVDLNLELIKNKLKDKLNISDISYTYINDPHQKQKIATSPINIIAELIQNGKIEDIPHKLDFGCKKNEPMWGLISLRGRAPICLKCGIEGHTRPFCIYKKCRRCKKNYKGDSHSCEYTYASKTKEKIDEYDEEENLIDLHQDVEDGKQKHKSEEENSIVHERSKGTNNIYENTENNHEMDLQTMGKISPINENPVFACNMISSPLSTIGASPNSGVMSEVDESDTSMGKLLFNTEENNDDSMNDSDQELETDHSTYSIDIVTEEEKKMIRDYERKKDDRTSLVGKPTVGYAINKKDVDDQGVWKVATSVKRKRRKRGQANNDSVKKLLKCTEEKGYTTNNRINE